MNINDYISSGILELYVLNQLTPTEREEVEKLANENFEIKSEIEKISKALEQYALQTAIPMPEGLADKIMSSLPNKINTSAKSDVVNEQQAATKSIYKVLSILFGGLSLLLGILYYLTHESLKNSQSSFKSYQQTCDSIQNIYEQQNKYALDLQAGGNKVVQIEPSPNFSDAVIFIHNNDAKQINYLQISNLPELDNGKAYQLWALAEGQDPMPLDVFKLSKTFIPVAYQAGVNYAITIEDEKGALVPDLSQLIGVFKTS